MVMGSLEAGDEIDLAFCSRDSHYTDIFLWHLLLMGH
jgi:hypothetical protein